MKASLRDTAPGPGSVVCCDCGNAVNGVLQLIPGKKVDTGGPCNHSPRSTKRRFVRREVSDVRV